MDFYTTTPTVGAKSFFVFDDNVVTQDSVNSIGVEVETLVIESNQAAFEAFLQSSAGLV